MNKHVPHIWLLLILSLLSCNRNIVINEDAASSINIDMSALNRKYKASELFDTIEIIPLETTDKSLIGNVSKIIVSESIYIMDDKDMSISVFDLKGKFLLKINERGLGPQEYISIYDFTITPSGRIIILDGESKNILTYDVSGNFLSKQRLTFFADAIEAFDDRFFVLNGSSIGPRVFVWDMDESKVINSYFEYDRRFSTRILKPLIKYKNKIYYTRAYSSLFYNITVDQAEAEWYIDFGERVIKEEDLQQNPWGLYLPPIYAADMGYFTETDYFVIFSFECEELNYYPYFVFYDKDSGIQKIITHEKYTDDILFNKYPPQIVNATADGRFIQVISMYELLDNRSQHNPIKFNEDQSKTWNDYETVLSGANEFDNPVILLYTLKRFQDE